MAVDTVLYFGLIMLTDYGVFDKLNDMLMKRVIGTEIDVQQLEDDVLTEKEWVRGKIGGSPQQSSDDIMLVHNLVKKFKANFAAVKGVSFGVAPGECFGLLGVNGAGKTTTFRMLTGDEIPSSGDALINQYRLQKENHKYLAQIGYCPQFDGINETLTGHEMLELFASLRGIPKANIDNEVKKWISLMGLEEYENRQCGTYSGGNKRKLSTAMALIGDPPIVFLDEPTSGVDPVARRNLWTVLTSIQKSGQSIVLTSHSMEECEAMCNRLAIMVGGQFMCMGGTQYLKQKYGQGFTVMVKLRVDGTSEETVKSLKNEIENNFNTGCILKDEHQGLLHYHVTNPNTHWKYLFLTMERVKQGFKLVEDYTISETTLEQVFLSFAKAQPPNP